MLAKKSAKSSSKKTPISQKKARVAARAAKKLYDSKTSKRPAAWKTGGREWSRVLGHFGITTSPF